jgi:cell division transport system ATP-binding protein
MIEMYHVYMAYQKDTNTLEDINLKVEKGEFVLLTGPSGAGKSTLLKLITCQERATKGQILVGGRNIARIRSSSIPYLRRNTGIVFQDFKLMNKKTIMENVILPLEIVGKSRKEVKHKAWNILKMVGLQHKTGSFPLQLSGGEQQRVAIARALVNDPAILLADEPTGNLDAENSEYIMELLRVANARGTTIMLATHDKDIIERYHYRIVHLEKGKLMSRG